MIDVPHPPADRSRHLVERGVRMPGVAADAAGPASADKTLGARQLGGHGGRGDAIGKCQVLLVLFGNRWANASARMRAARFVGKIGAVEMSADDAGAAGPIPFQPPAQLQECEVLVVAS